MPIEFASLIPTIDRLLTKIEREARKVPAWILTEDDLKCILFNKLSNIPQIRRPSPTQDREVLGKAVHAEASWYGELSSNGRWPLSIKPDITIVEPEHLSILHGYIEPLRTNNRPSPFARRNQSFLKRREVPPLPNKRFEFGGKAITFELKFARKGINQKMFKLIQADFKQIERLFRILDYRGAGNSIYSYLVIFDKFGSSPPRDQFAEFLYQNEESYRHKIVYKTLRVKLP